MGTRPFIKPATFFVVRLVSRASRRHGFLVGEYINSYLLKSGHTAMINGTQVKVNFEQKQRENLSTFSGTLGMRGNPGALCSYVSKVHERDGFK